MNDSNFKKIGVKTSSSINSYGKAKKCPKSSNKAKLPNPDKKKELDELEFQFENYDYNKVLKGEVLKNKFKAAKKYIVLYKSILKDMNRDYIKKYDNDISKLIDIRIFNVYRNPIPVII